MALEILYLIICFLYFFFFSFSFFNTECLAFETGSRMHSSKLQREIKLGSWGGQFPGQYHPHSSEDE